MKVLMFGWEFPPHISGGLGTACFGLTRGLAAERIQVSFVVPKLLGDEAADRVQLISASEIEIPFPSGAQVPPVKVIRKAERVIYEEQPPRIKGTKNTRWITRLYVDSFLDPYDSPLFREKSWTVEKWNYAFETTDPLRRIETTLEESEERPYGYYFNFSGGYGAALMEEVRQFALAGGELARGLDHDVVHAHDWMTYPAGIAAKKASKRPLIIHVHATEFDRSGYCGGPVFELEKEGLYHADRIIAVSNWTKEILVTQYGVAREKISVVHNGIVAKKGKDHEPSVVGSHVVTFLGRVTHQKGPYFFVEAARKVAEKFPEAHFIVAGSGDLLPQIIERVAHLRMSSRFHFTGFLNKEWIDRIWSLSDVYVMPSVSEPFGITPLEAIQGGVPVIISNQSGVAEVMEHALKVDFWDVDGLAGLICSVLSYKSLSSMLKQKGEGEVRRMSWNKAARKIKDLYEETVSQNRPEAHRVVLSGASAPPP